MNLIDFIIIIFIFTLGVVGLKRGVFKELVLCLGTIILFYFAYKFKNSLGNFFLLKFPLFDFLNLFKGVITLNILVYQLIAFILILAVLLVIFEIILSVTGLFEKILKITIILGIPSKILGFIVGLIEGYVIAFVILFFLNQPAFSFDFLMESKFTNNILTSSPVLTNITSNMVETFESIYALKDEKDTNKLNQKTLDIMLDKGVVEYDVVSELYNNNKLKFEGIEIVLNKYKK